MNRNFKNYILQSLIGKNEGICSKHGYIKKNSIVLQKVSVGAIEAQSLRGFVNYDVQFSALVCNPTNGSILKCKVLNSNNFGILCVCGIYEDGNFLPIIDIIIPKNSLHIQSNENIDMNSLNKNDIINVEIVGKKFEINDKKISAVGKIVDINDGTVPLFDVENNEIDENKKDGDEESYEDDFTENPEMNKKMDDKNDDDDLDSDLEDSKNEEEEINAEDNNNNEIPEISDDDEVEDDDEEEDEEEEYL
tara:strand:+ start:1367 stop:2113 length:747 start_codon:yes stop_codon:yes gene_type:complete